MKTRFQVASQLQFDRLRLEKIVARGKEVQNIL